MMPLPRILACDGVAAAGVQLLRQHAEVVECGALDEAALAAALPGVHALLVRSATKVTARALDAADCLRVIARAGVGIDNIDLEAATRRGVLVVNSPAGNILAAAEHTIALLLSAARNIPQADASMKQGRFDRKTFIGRQISGKTLGIVGMGKIGTEVARRARALGMELIACDPFASAEHMAKLGARVASLDELLGASDFVTVHVPISDGTRSLIAEAQLSLMPSHAIIINCARGGVIDEAALLEALETRRIAGAALDVFEHEPEPCPGLVCHPSVIATPHLGASTTEAQETVVLDAAEQVLDVLAGRAPSSPVNAPALAPELLAELQPYLALVGHLSGVAAALVRSAPASVSLAASAAAPAAGIPLLISRLVAGLLAGRIDQTVNEVNAPLIAAERGIRLAQTTVTQDPGYSRYVEVDIHHEGRVCRLAGAVLEAGQPRILRIDGFTVDVMPEGRALLILKRDPRTPGFIGAIGTILGTAGIGIVNIQAGDEIIDETGLLVARVHDDVPASVRQAIEEHPEVIRLEVVSFD